MVPGLQAGEAEKLAGDGFVLALFDDWLQAEVELRYAGVAELMDARERVEFAALVDRLHAFAGVDIGVIRVELPVVYRTLIPELGEEVVEGGVTVGQAGDSRLGERRRVTIVLDLDDLRPAIPATITVLGLGRTGDPEDRDRGDRSDEDTLVKPHGI